MSLRMVRHRGEAETLAWLMGNDEEERSNWTDMFRHSELTFGQIVQKVMRQREASLVPPPTTSTQGGGGQVGGGGRQQPPPDRRKGEGKGGGGAQKTKQETGVSSMAQKFEVCDTMSNGKALCAEYNKGRCSTKNCSKGLHLCNRKCRNGRACGFNNHMAKDCRNQKAV